MTILSGVYTALVTPFSSNKNSLDEDALRRIIKAQVNSGVDGIVPCGTTGESPTLSVDEHMRVIEIALEETNDDVSVIAGTGANSTKEAIELTKMASNLGIKYSLQVAPYYNKPMQKGFYEHFVEIASKFPNMKFIIYNIPGRSGKNIETETILKLMKIENIVAVKEASGNINQIMDIAIQKDKDFSLLSGDDNLTLPIISVGGSGVISVVSNVCPSLLKDMVSFAIKGDGKKALELHNKLYNLFKIMFIESNPIPVKYAVSEIFKINNTLRLPMTSLDKKYEKEIKNYLSDLGKY